MNHGAEEMAEASSEPAVSNNALICDFSERVSARAILDLDAGLVHFKNCHTPRKFLARPSTWYSCRMSDLKGVHYLLGSLTVSTPAGKAVIPSNGTHHHELQRCLKESVPANQPEFATDHPVMLLVHIFGGLLGLFVGFALHRLLIPPGSSESSLVPFLILGLPGGILSLQFIILLFGRFLNIDLVQPIGYGVAGFALSLVTVGPLLNRFLSAPMTAAIVVVLFGGFGGVVYGFYKTRKSDVRIQGTTAGKHIAEQQALASDKPNISNNALICEFSGRADCTVILDLESEMIHFGNCHRIRQFFARPAGWYSCRISDLKGIHCNGSLTVSTASGRATIPSSATCYDAIRRYLMEAAPANRAEFSTDNPITYEAYACASLLGLFAGQFLTPPNSDGAWINAAGIIGSFGGWLTCYILFLLTGRVLKIDLAQSIAFGVIWAAIGAYAGACLEERSRSETTVIPMMSSAGGAAGVAYGLYKRRR